MMKVLFVCLGNICRSPLAEAIFKHKVKSIDLDGSIYADSCGTAGYHIGELADPRTRANAQKNGVTITHRGRQLQSSDLEEFDYILAMDQSNLSNIKRLSNSELYSEKIYLMRSFDPHPGEEVPDPYYGDEKDFQQVFEILDRSIDHFLKEIRAKLL
ncbi:MAG: low molecular weight phosphotyrosine protein phosphatase [Cyclobacteriaceae bacterium]|nr:low molecular weight phosphotyrosine protein phosphatase [Cyclobacteriaceae bacterium]